MWMNVACVKNVLGRCVCQSVVRKQLKMYKVLYLTLINDVLAKVNHCLGCAKISDFEILRS